METTRHEIHFADSREMAAVPDGSVSLVVTSPPYPMIELWDAQFAAAGPDIADALEGEDGARAFDLMHLRLDRVWQECHRLLQPGGLACINIGDATRKIGGEFRLFSNHSRILQALTGMGFSVLPDILWRKPTNAPNKFLGSGMLPAGAYVTYEHEYILIVRKGGPRKFSPADRAPPPGAAPSSGKNATSGSPTCGSAWSAPGSFSATRDSMIPTPARAAPRTRSSWRTA